LKIQHPDKKVVLITFNNEVNYLGDGIGMPQVITGDKLNDYETLMKIGKELDVKNLKPIYQSMDALSKKVFALAEEGSTALGPALALAVALASNEKRSEVIICTDGLSNVGIGSLEEGKEAGAPFYEKIGKFAKQNETTVSVISIEGSDCAMDCLSSCADMTSGTVNIVNPLELVRQIRAISQNPVIATNVKVKLFAQNQFIWKWDSSAASSSSSTSSPSSSSSSSQKKSKKKSKSSFTLENDIGNATAATDLTFGFTVKKGKTVSTDTVPFQAQIFFTKDNGMQCMRVITTSKPITQDRDLAEREADVAVIALEAIQEAARIAQKGNYQEARIKLFAVQKLLKRAAKTDTQMEEHSNFVTLSEELDYELRETIWRMKKGNNNNNNNSRGSSSSSKSSSTQSLGMGDTTAKTLFKMKTASRNQFLSGSRKTDLVDKRQHTDATLRDMYYATKF